MAVVYLAEDTMLERRVAVKALTEQYADDNNFRERFRREGRILARAQHESIVPIFDSGEANNIPYLVMKLMPGGTLADRIAHSPLPADRALGVLTRIASALDAAHAAGVIHRDLKPANVLFDERDQAYVADFGVGRLDGTASGVTQPGTVIGTAQYMSPEQVQGGQPSNASDIYSFGALAYETLVGSPPFSGTDVWAVMRQHLEAPVPRPSVGRPWLAFADGAIMAALAKRPEDRPRSDTAIVEALRRAAQPVAASTAPPPTRVATMPAATPPPVVRQPARASRGSSWRAPILIAAVGGAIAAALVSVILASILNDDDEKQGGGDDTRTATATRTPDDEDTPTPTEEGSSTPEPTPTNTPRTQVPGIVFLRESFDSAARSSVAEFSDQFGVGIIADGQLQMVDTADDGRLVWYRWNTGRQDVSVQVKAFAAEGLFTMACRDDDQYQVRVSVETRTQLFKTSIYNEANEAFSTYIDWTGSDLISLTEKSTLELVCRANSMEFAINGVTVASHTIEGTSGTYVWIAADGGVDSNVFIDDIVITLLQ